MPDLTPAERAAVLEALDRAIFRDGYGALTLHGLDLQSAREKLAAQQRLATIALSHAA